MSDEQRLATLGSKDAPLMFECCRFPAVVSITLTNQGSIVATARPAMRANETCGEHETSAEYVVRSPPLAAFVASA